MSSCANFRSFFCKPAVVFAGAILVTLSFLFVDKPLAIFLHNIDLRTNLSFLNIFTKLGIGLIYLLLSAATALFFRYIQPNKAWEERAWFIFLCVLIPSMICGGLKVILGRARPSMWFEGHYFGFYGLQTKAPFWSFPSGHTTTIMAVAVGLGFLFPRAACSLLTAGFLVAMSRILLTHHYLSDVLFASYLVFLEITLLLAILQHYSWLPAVWMNNKSCPTFRNFKTKMDY